VMPFSRLAISSSQITPNRVFNNHECFPGWVESPIKSICVRVAGKSRHSAASAELMFEGMIDDMSCGHTRYAGLNPIGYGVYGVNGAYGVYGVYGEYGEYGEYGMCGVYGEYGEYGPYGLYG